MPKPQTSRHSRTRAFGTLKATAVLASTSVLLLLGAASGQAAPLISYASTVTEPDSPIVDTETTTDPGVDDGSSTAPDVPIDESDTPTPSDSGEPTDPSDSPTEPTASETPTESADPTNSATPTPTATTKPTVPAESAPPLGGTDLEGIDFVNRDDLAQAANDPAAQAALGTKIEQQLKLIDEALKAAQAKVNTTGAAWNDAHTKAEDARSEVLDLEAQAEEKRDEASLSDEQVTMMVQRMRQGTYVVPPEVEVFLRINPNDDLLYQYGMVSQLGINESYVSQTAKAAVVEINDLRARAEVKKDEAEKLEAEAKTAKDAATAAQEKLAAQVKIAEKNHDELEKLLKELGIEVPEDSYLTGLLAARAALRTTQPGAVNSQGYSTPLPNTPVTSPFGMRLHPITGEPRMHFGVDFANGSTCGATLFATAAGTVTFSGWMGGYGNAVEITMADGTELFYAHIQDGGLGVHVGEKVKAGQPIALAGTTGTSTGCHLHFEVRVAGQPIEPMGWLTSRGL